MGNRKAKWKGTFLDTLERNSESKSQVASAIPLILVFCAVLLAVWTNDWQSLFFVLSFPAAIILAYLWAFLIGVFHSRRQPPNLSKTDSGGVSCLSVCIMFCLLQFVSLAVFGLDFGSSIGRWTVFFLILAAILPLWVAVLTVGGALFRRGRAHKCGSCDLPGHFRLACGAPYELLESERYCRNHFLNALKDDLRNYKGRFVVVERDPNAGSNQAQYVFYAPQDLAADSYSEQDVQYADSLVSKLVDENPSMQQDKLAVTVDHRFTKRIGDWNSEPLFRVELDNVTGQPLNLDEFLTYIHQIAFDFDHEGREFHMNLPYADRGIYLWHDYI